MKRTLTLLLCVMLVTAFLPSMTFADTGDTASGQISDTGAGNGEKTESTETEEYVAELTGKIDGETQTVKYKTLQEAFDYIEKCNTSTSTLKSIIIKLLNDVNENIVYKKSALTLDLNGHSITNSGQESPTIQMEANSTIKLTDSSDGENKGSIINTTNSQPAIKTTLKSATVEVRDGICIQGGLYNVQTVGTLRLYNGILSGSNTAAVHLENGTGKFYAYSGTVESDGYGVQMEGAQFNATKSGNDVAPLKFNCDKGIIKATAGSCEIYKGVYVVGTDKELFDISGTATLKISGKYTDVAPTFCKAFDEKYLYESYELVGPGEGGMYGVNITAPATIIRDGKETTWQSLSRALQAAQSGDTVRLDGDLNIGSSWLYITKSITLDLNKHTITTSSLGTTMTVGANGSNTFQSEITVIIKNGTIQNTAAPADSQQANVALLVRNKADVTLENVTLAANGGSHSRGLWVGTPFISGNQPSDKDGGPTATISEGCNISGTEMGIFLGAHPTVNTEGSPTILNVAGGNISGGKFAIGSYYINDGTEINISAGEITAETGTAIHQPQNGTLNISGGRITGANGVQVSGAGEVNISGGIIKATGTAQENPTGSWATGGVENAYNDGAAVSFVYRDRIGGLNLELDSYGAEKSLTVNITGGTLISENNQAIREYGKNGKTVIKDMMLSEEDESTPLTVTGADGKAAVEFKNLLDDEKRVIEGGTYSSDVSDYCVNGRTIKKNDDGTFTVEDVATTPVTPPVVPTTQHPTIETDDNAAVALSSDGTRATITVADGYELVDVTVNGVSKGAVTELTGLKTGDKVVITTKKIETPDDDAALIEAVKNTRLVARSVNTKAPSGKKAIKVYWYAKDGSKLNFDGYEIYRSTKKNSGYGTKPIYTAKKLQYFNTSAKKGTRYYYKVRGYKEIGGERIYTPYSLKAIRTAK